MDLLGSFCDIHNGKNVFIGIKFRRPEMFKREICSVLLETQYEMENCQFCYLCRSSLSFTDQASAM